MEIIGGKVIKRFMVFASPSVFTETRGFDSFLGSYETIERCEHEVEEKISRHDGWIQIVSVEDMKIVQTGEIAFSDGRWEIIWETVKSRKILDAN